MTASGIFSNLLAMTVSVGLLQGAVAHAQEQNEQSHQPGESVSYCQSHDGFDDFDFWVGEWRVYNLAQDRQFAGTNTITKTERGCLIEEHWESASGGTGMSINYFNPVTGEWRQVWISGPGYAIDYTGGLNGDGEMVLEGTIYYYTGGRTAPFRGTWTPRQDGTVRQFFEQFDAEEGVWQTWFDGLYVPAEADQRAR